MMRASIAFLAWAMTADAAYLDKRQAVTTITITSTAVPDYFQTSPELFPGPTATSVPPFLAESNPAPFGPSNTFVANAPLETGEPIMGDITNTSIFSLMGNLSPYFPNPSGFGVQEYPLPLGANISQVHMISRHGSRYPTTNSSVYKFGTSLASAIKKGAYNFTEDLSFLNSWNYKLGAEILVPIGRQELFDSGVLHQYQYGALYNPNTKIIARTTSQDRIIKSGENFLSGFFGLSWSANATLEVIIEQNGFNDSLAGYDNCNNSNTYVSAGGSNASATWENIYLQNATKRLSAMAGGYNWTLSDTYNAQTICPYETVALGYSAFCDLFTFEEWQGFEYSIDLSFAGGSMFQSPTGRAVGIGFVQETLAILQHHLVTDANTQDNVTLDGTSSTFPLNQTLYFSFSHDTNIASVLTAFGLTQFAQFLPTTGPPANQQMIVSHMEPFGARLDIEIISAPQPVAANRTTSANTYINGPATKYVHFLLNQRTVPLGASFAACGKRTDGWCELTTFMGIQNGSLATAQYDYSCNGNYPSVPYGSLSNGVPQST